MKTTLLMQAWSRNAVLLAGTACLLVACGSGAEKDAAADTMPKPDTVGAMMTATSPAAPDAEMAAVLDELGTLNGKPIESLEPAEARKQPTPADAVKQLMTKLGMPTTPPPGTSMKTRTVAGAAGQLAANVYTPDGPGPFPVIVYYHGGGWVIANTDVYDGGARGLSIAAKAIVISANYRQAPEHKFPAAHDDAVAIYEWTVKNAASLNGDPKRIALAGESAGGNLAVATAIAARDKGMQAPLAVISVYPIAGRDTNTASYVENASAKPLNRAMMSWFFDKYVRTPADGQDPRINLVGADLKGLPPITIINAQIDPLRTDGEVLAERIRGAGGTVDQKTYLAVAHEFFGMAAVHPKAKDAQAYAAAALATVFK